MQAMSCKVPRLRCIWGAPVLPQPGSIGRLPSFSPLVALLSSGGLWSLPGPFRRNSPLGLFGHSTLISFTMSSHDTHDLLTQMSANIKAKDSTSFDRIITQLERLQALAKVYSQLASTAHLLRDRQRSDLPRTRQKHGCLNSIMCPSCAPHLVVI